MCVVIVESFFSAKILNHGLESMLMRDLGRAAGIILFIYLVIKIADLAARGSLGMVFEGSLQSRLFLLEMVGCVALPAILLSIRKVRLLPRWLLGASLLVMAGIVLNRINVSWFGMSVSDHLHYIPTWMEIALSLAFITGGTVIFLLAVRFLPIFPKTADEPAELHG